MDRCVQSPHPAKRRDERSKILRAVHDDLYRVLSCRTHPPVQPFGRDLRSLLDKPETNDPRRPRLDSEVGVDRQVAEPYRAVPPPRLEYADPESEPPIPRHHPVQQRQLPRTIAPPSPRHPVAPRDQPTVGIVSVGAGTMMISRPLRPLTRTVALAVSVVRPSVTVPSR